MAARISHNTRSTRELSSRERLSQISHHFLSDDQPSAPPVESHTNRTMSDIPGKTAEQDKQPFILPILMSTQQKNYFPVYTLSEALLAHNKSSAVLLVEGELSSTNSSTVFKPHTDHGPTQYSANQNPLQHLLQQTGYQHKPDIYLIPVASISSPYVKLSQRLLVPVQASLEGIRSAYLHLKGLTAVNRDIAIGIILFTSDDPSWARRCYEKLATAARQFLGLAISSYGYLPDIAYPESLNPQQEINKQGLPHEMMEVADMILLDLE